MAWQPVMPILFNASVVWHSCPIVYLGAKHMFTGYDHLLFLAGVIFFLYKMKDVALYVSLFAVGHSVTLLLGVLGGIRADAYIVDAIIGLSVVYKAFENMGGFERMGVYINTRHAVFLFGLAHGFGLSTKLQDLSIASEGLVPNMLAFNVGVELGQLAALTIMLLAFQFWRQSPSFSERGFHYQSDHHVCRLYIIWLPDDRLFYRLTHTQDF